MPRVGTGCQIFSCGEVSHGLKAPGQELSWLPQLCQFLRNAVTLTWWCYSHLLSQEVPPVLHTPDFPVLFGCCLCRRLAIYSFTFCSFQTRNTTIIDHFSCPHRTPIDVRSGTQLPFWDTSLEFASAVGTCSSSTGQSACSFLLSARMTGVSHHIQFRFYSVLKIRNAVQKRIKRLPRIPHTPDPD